MGPSRKNLKKKNEKKTLGDPGLLRTNLTEINFKKKKRTNDLAPAGRQLLLAGFPAPLSRGGSLRRPHFCPSGLGAPARPSHAHGGRGCALGPAREDPNSGAASGPGSRWQGQSWVGVPSPALPRPAIAPCFVTSLNPKGTTPCRAGGRAGMPGAEPGAETVHSGRHVL